MTTFADEHLRQFLLARSSGDAEAMKHWWGRLVEDFHDRIRARVVYESAGRLDADEREDAVQLCLESFSGKLITSFKGTTMGELVNATKRLVHFRCIDIQRAERRHGGPSLDSGWEEDDPERPPPAWEYEESRHRYEQQERSDDLVAFTAWAIPQLEERRRRVVELTLAGASVEEICAELGVTRDNAYQLRSRAAKDFAKLKEQYDA